MAEDVEFEGFQGNQMELLLESDEEEASLLEEMEKNQINPIVNPISDVKTENISFFQSTENDPIVNPISNVKTENISSFQSTENDLIVNPISIVKTENISSFQSTENDLIVNSISNVKTENISSFQSTENDPIVHPISNVNTENISSFQSTENHPIRVRSEYGLTRLSKDVLSYLQTNERVAGHKNGSDIVRRAQERFIRKIDGLSQGESGMKRGGRKKGSKNKKKGDEVMKGLKKGIGSVGENNSTFSNSLRAQDLTGGDGTDLIALQEKVLQTILGSNGTDVTTLPFGTDLHYDGDFSMNIKEEPSDNVQILESNMSAHDFILAKSAASFKYHDSSFPSEVQLSSHRLKKAHIIQDAGGTEYIFHEANGLSPKRAKEIKMLNKIMIPESRTDHKFKRTAPYDDPRKLSRYKLGTDIDSQLDLKEEDEWGSSIKKRLRKDQNKSKDEGIDWEMDTRNTDSDTEQDSSKPVSFTCNFCKFKVPFVKESLDQIVDHLTPPERYNQLHKVPAKLKAFKENVKLSVMVAKNKRKAQVRLVNRLECITCHQHFPFDIDSGDQINSHYYWCTQKINTNTTPCNCLFCDNLIPRGTIKKHLSPFSRKPCPINCASTLQLMSCVCKIYAAKVKPVCVVCNEKRWPYLGQPADMNAVCDPCRANITSGKTTKLVVRDVTGCAICSKYCSSKFVTYWASELESLFIGESCILKLQEPIKTHSQEIRKTKTEKISKLVELAIESVNLPHNMELLEHKKSTSDVSSAGQALYNLGFTNLKYSENNKQIPMPVLSSQIMGLGNQSALRNEPPPRPVISSSSQPGTYTLMGSNLTPFSTLTTPPNNSDNSQPSPVTHMVRVGSNDSPLMLIPESEMKGVPNNLGVLGTDLKTLQILQKSGRTKHLQISKGGSDFKISQAIRSGKVSTISVPLGQSRENTAMRVSAVSLKQKHEAENEILTTISQNPKERLQFKSLLPRAPPPTIYPLPNAKIPLKIATKTPYTDNPLPNANIPLKIATKTACTDNPLPNANIPLKITTKTPYTDNPLPNAKIPLKITTKTPFTVPPPAKFVIKCLSNPKTDESPTVIKSDVPKTLDGSSDMPKKPIIVIGKSCSPKDKSPTGMKCSDVPKKLKGSSDVPQKPIVVISKTLSPKEKVPSVLNRSDAPKSLGSLDTSPKPIVIKASSKCSKPQSNEVPAPRVAHVIRTQWHVFDDLIMIKPKPKPVPSPVQVKVLPGTKSNTETVILD